MPAHDHPWVDPTTALPLVAVTGDIRRFRRPAKLVSDLGLDPRVHQPGEREAWIGRTSRAGHSDARSLLVEAAHAAVGAPGPLRAFFRRVERRRGVQVALVAVARKLVVLAWRLLISCERYRFECATIMREKRRALERRLGVPAVRRRPARGQPSLALQRERELASLVDAEAAHRADVAARTRKDAAAANGEATEWPSKGRDARRSFRPQRSALLTGSTASEDALRGLDAFIRTRGVESDPRRIQRTTVPSSRELPRTAPGDGNGGTGHDGVGLVREVGHP